jgi:hypothetical protein
MGNPVKDWGEIMNKKELPEPPVAPELPPKELPPAAPVPPAKQPRLEVPQN